MSTAPLRRVSVDEARRDILSHVTALSRFEDVPSAAAAGRVSTETVESPVAVPAYTNSAMDGFAYTAATLPAGDSVTLPIAGESLAGHPCLHAIPAGAACRITTGAKFPEGCDTVIPFEKTTSDGRTVTFARDAVKAGANVRHQGETLRPGDVVIAAGTRLTPAHAALLANLGFSKITVTAPVRAAVIATGDELVEPGRPCPEDRLYNANSTALTSLLSALGCDVVDFGIVPDAPDAVQEAFLRAAEDCDIVFTSGGAAAGEADFTHKVLEAEGEIRPWEVSMRPGKPMRFGLLSEKPVFLLPGNPVAAVVTFLEFARPAILAMAGVAGDAVLPVEIPLKLAADAKKKDGRAEFMRARLTVDENGEAAALPLKDQGSAALTNLTGSDLILALPAEGSLIPSGTLVPAQLLSELMH